MFMRRKHYAFDDRCLSHRGCVIDVGCFTWDWSIYFVEKGKRVIGFDFNESTQPQGTELRKQMVLPYSGQCFVHIDGHASSIMNKVNASNGVQCDAVSFDSVLSEFHVMPSLIKINVEGAEYPLLFSLKAPPCDQLVVSFHDWGTFPYPKQLSEVVRNYLSVWYNWSPTYGKFSWWVGLLKDEFRVL